MNIVALPERTTTTSHDPYQVNDKGVVEVAGMPIFRAEVPDKSLQPAEMCLRALIRLRAKEGHERAKRTLGAFLVPIAISAAGAVVGAQVHDMQPITIAATIGATLGIWFGVRTTEDLTNSATRTQEYMHALSASPLGKQTIQVGSCEHNATGADTTPAAGQSILLPSAYSGLIPSYELPPVNLTGVGSCRGTSFPALA